MGLVAETTTGCEALPGTVSAVKVHNHTGVPMTTSATSPTTGSVRDGWETLGTVEVAAGSRLEVGDPCHGLEDLGVTLAAGTWTWQQRHRPDTLFGGDSSSRIAEIRALHTPAADPARLGGVEEVPEWDWEDAYGYYTDRPAADTLPISIRGVDAGIIAWRITRPQRAGQGELAGPDHHLDYGEEFPDEDLLDGTQGFRDDRQVLVTYTGYGDGAYPVTARTLDGTPDTDAVEVRACYVAADSGPLDAEEFSRLLPGAYRRAGLTVPDHGSIHVRVEQTQYTAVTDRTRTDTADHDYSQLVFASPDPLTFADPARLDQRTDANLGLGIGNARAPRSLQESDPDLVWDLRPLTDTLANLWSRLTPEAIAELSASSSSSATIELPDHIQGFITRYAVTSHLHTLVPTT